MSEIPTEHPNGKDNGDNGAPPKATSKQGKASNGAGSVERRGKEWWARVSLPDGRRRRIPIPNSEKMSEAMAREKAAVYSEKCREGEIVFHERPRRGKAPVSGPSMTVRQVGEAWTSGELLKTHGPVNGLKPMTGGYIMGTTLGKRAYRVKVRGPNGPDFGDLRAADVTHADIAKIMALQTGAASTRNHVHGYLARIFSLAEIPLGVRPVGSNPALAAYRAPADEEKHFNFLYPPEVLALLANEKIPLGRRILYLLANYFGWRRGTLRAFKWSGIDWADGTVSVLKQKGYRRLDATAEDKEQGRPIFFVADPSTIAVLRAWYEHCGSPPGDSAVVRNLWAPEERHRENHDEAHVIRADLQASGIKREILFSKAHNVQRIRFHDGRATFTTWARRAGKSDVWIRERAGWAPASNMIDRYARMAQTLADMDYEPFPDVATAIPELAENAVRLATTLATRMSRRGTKKREESTLNLTKPLGCEGGDLNPYASYGASTSSGPPGPEGGRGAPNAGDREPTLGAVEAPKCAIDQSVANVADAVEAALAYALDRASAAGRFDVVASLVEELHARRSK
jgi:integrase